MGGFPDGFNSGNTYTLGVNRFGVVSWNPVWQIHGAVKIISSLERGPLEKSK